ncbi:MAG TPA: RNA-binding S4 domain-containing protein [Candidatus Tectomicrobia bacterium]|nr:RNA-binding S4 domain-containing protein [Candidatus Tectomicrobia bacterium]
MRVDRWLRAARVFRTRGLASEACDGGKVDVNDAAAKPARALRVGDVVRITLPAGRRRVLKVAALGDRRGPASAARALYEDLTPPEPRVREPVAAYRPPGAGRPTKRQRRQIDRLRA